MDEGRKMAKKTKVLIIGFGRAGKRHAKLLRTHFPERNCVFGIIDHRVKASDNIEQYIIDNAIYNSMLYDKSFDDALNIGWDIAIIATPPQYHLWYMEKCISNHMWVMLEKPLCDFDQLDLASHIIGTYTYNYRVMVSYNYRFNPDLSVTTSVDSEHSNHWTVFSRQHRQELPPWGLVLDHVSHDIDNIRFLSNHDIETVSAVDANFMMRHEKLGEQSVRRLRIKGTLTNDHTFDIVEIVWLSQHIIRLSYIREPHPTNDDMNLMHAVTPNKDMFINMWKVFLDNMDNNHPQSPSLEDAYGTQLGLQKIADFAKWDKAGFTAL